MCLRVHDLVRGIESQVAVAGYKALKTEYHNAFSGVEEMLGAHGDTKEGDVAAMKERRDSKNNSYLTLVKTVRPVDRLLSRLSNRAGLWPFIRYSGCVCHCHSPPLTPRKRRPAYLHCLRSAGISQIGSPGERVEYHNVAVASELWFSVSEASCEAVRKAGIQRKYDCQDH